MQCANTYWASNGQLPLIRASNSLAKLSATETRTQALRNPNGYSDNGDNSGSSVVAISLPSHVKSITSTSNPFVKHCLKLRLCSSYRRSQGSVLLVGTTPIREIYKFQESMQERTATIDCLLVLDKAEIPEGLNDLPIRTVHVSSMVMKKLSGLQSTESIETIALMKFPSTFLDLDDNRQEADCHRWFPSPHRILVLDGIQRPREYFIYPSKVNKSKSQEDGIGGTSAKGSYLGALWHGAKQSANVTSLTENFYPAPVMQILDPGNLGTLLRSALAFRWGGVFLLPGCCDPFNEKALRASRGASFQLPIVSGSWIHLEALRNKLHMKILAGHPVNSENSKQLKPVSCLSQGLADSLADMPLCLVLGSEGNGLTTKTRQLSELVSIRMVGEFESLNVSVAGGIFLYMLQPGNHRSA